MAVTKIGQFRQGLSYGDTLNGDFSGGVSALYNSTLTDPEDAINEIITYIEGTEGFTLGAQLAEPPYDKMIVTGRSIVPAEKDDANHWLVTFTFGPKEKKTIAGPADWVFSFSSSLSSGETNTDAYGSFIEVGTLDGDTETRDDDDNCTAVPKVGATVEKNFPSIKITASGKFPTNPFSLYKDKVGKLNSTAMTVDGQTLAIGTTMLVSANVRTPNDGDFYLVDYEYEYRDNLEDWLAVIYAVNPGTGQPWAGIVEKQNKTSATTYNPVTPSSGPNKGCVAFLIYEFADIGSLIS